MAAKKSASPQARASGVKPLSEADPPAPQPPSVGRIVHYISNPESEPQAAIISRVPELIDGEEDRRSVWLTIFSPAMPPQALAFAVPHEDAADDGAPRWRFPERV